MRLFSRKTKTDAVEFTRDFYDRFVFDSPAPPGDFALVFADTTRRLVSETDASFANVNLPKLKEELRALQLEMIGTAWTYKSKEKVALAIPEFTKKHLANTGRSDLWKAMIDYNKVVAQSATFGADSNSRVGRARIMFVSQMRASLFDSWVKQGWAPEAAGRVANRLGSYPSWKAGATQLLLAIRLTQRLDFEGSDEVWERLAAVAFGMYQGAKEALDGITLTVKRKHHD